MIWAAALLLLAGERTSIGIYDAWGAFRDDEPARCYAITASVRSGDRAFASVATRFGRNGRRALYIRFSTRRNTAAPVTLAIGERRFTLTGNDRAAWSPDVSTDRAIVAAMRGARSMSVAAVSAAGRAFADSYALGGAASAIDAATLGCAT